MSVTKKCNNLIIKNFVYKIIKHKTCHGFLICGVVSKMNKMIFKEYLKSHASANKWNRNLTIVSFSIYSNPFQKHLFSAKLKWIIKEIRLTSDRTGTIASKGKCIQFLGKISQEVLNLSFIPQVKISVHHIKTGSDLLIFYRVN